MAAVKFRGLDPRTGLARWGLAAVAIGIVVGGDSPGGRTRPRDRSTANPEALVWLFERLFAWLAYIAVAGSVIYGLLLSTRILDAIAHRPISFSLHQDLAAFGLGLAGIHGMLLGLDHTVPFSIAQILVPGLAPHAPVAVAFGQVALYLMAAVTASFYLRKRIGQRAWRTFHYVTFLAFAGTTVHGIASGSDSNAPWAEAIYLASALLVLFLLTYRIGMSMAARGETRRAAAGATGAARATGSAGDVQPSRHRRNGWPLGRSPAALSRRHARSRSATAPRSGGTRPPEGQARSGHRARAGSRRASRRRPAASPRGARRRTRAPGSTHPPRRDRRSGHASASSDRSCPSARCAGS